MVKYLYLFLLYFYLSYKQKPKKTNYVNTYMCAPRAVSEFELLLNIRVVRISFCKNKNYSKNPFILYKDLWYANAYRTSV